MFLTWYSIGKESYYLYILLFKFYLLTKIFNLMKRSKFFKRGSRSIIMLFVLAFMAMGAQQAVAQQYYEGTQALLVLKEISQNVEAETKVVSGHLTKGVSATPTKQLKLKYVRGLFNQFESNVQGGLKGTLDAYHASFIQANPRLAAASQIYYQEIDQLLKN